MSINARIDKDKADRAEISEKVAALHNFLMEEGVDGDPPMKKRLSVIVVTGERSVWALKWVSRLIGFVAILTGVVVGIVKLRG